MSQLDDSFNMAMLPKYRHRKFPGLTLGEKRNLRPSRCDICRGLMREGGGLTLFRGKWLCDVCQDDVRKGKL